METWIVRYHYENNYYGFRELVEDIILGVFNSEDEAIKCIKDEIEDKDISTTRFEEVPSEEYIRDNHSIVVVSKDDSNELEYYSYDKY